MKRRSLGRDRGTAGVERVALGEQLVQLIAFVIAVGAIAGCDAGLVADAPTVVCGEAGDQCQLAAGPLGVCERTACTAGEESPCFECVSQH